MSAQLFEIHLNAWENARLHSTLDQPCFYSCFFFCSFCLDISSYDSRTVLRYLEGDQRCFP
eukprot:1159813-Pelagomonas_calceolata.AAC.21